MVVAVAKRPYELNESLIFTREYGDAERWTTVVPVAVARTHYRHGIRAPNANVSARPSSVP